MKVTQQVENLIRQGRSPKELLELGFSKRAVTTVRRRMREEKAAQRIDAAKGQQGTKTQPGASTVAPEELVLIQKKLATLENDLQRANDAREVLRSWLNNTPNAGLRSRFKCKHCGADGLIATYIKCTKCNTANWWGWWPNKQSP